MKINFIHFKNHPVLGNLKFDFRINNTVRDFSILVGENGCGKTVFMEEIYKIFSSGIELWNDGVNRKVCIDISDEEKNSLGISINTLIFVYDESYSSEPNWSRIKILDKTGADVTRELISLIQNQQPFNKMLKCAYSPVEINFSLGGIDSIKASSIDTEKNPKSKAGANLVTEIAQLLVDISAQDNAESHLWLSQNKNQKVTVPKLDYKLDRFKKAYKTMFVGKELKEIRASNNKHEILFRDTIKNVEFNISQLSSGEKQIVYRAGYLLRNLTNLSGGIILIDEPELSLHPKWQEKYLDFLRTLFKNKNGKIEVQLLIATHSPLLLKEALSPDIGVFMFRKNKNGEIVSSDIHNNGFGRLNWSPTWGEVCYDAYDMYTQEFHDDLYAMLQVKTGRPRITGVRVGIEDWFISNGYNSDMVNWDDSSTNKTETFMTCIRNKMHHNDNQNRPNFSHSKLKKSIGIMIQILNDITTP